MRVTRGAEPDPKDPDWVSVAVEPVRPLERPVTLAEIKAEPSLAKMELIRQSRLSVAPGARRGMGQGAGDGGEMIGLASLCSAAQPGRDSRGGSSSESIAGYKHSELQPASPGRYFAPARSVAAIGKDSRLAQGEVGYLDGDPICQCQDAAGLRAECARVSVTGPGPCDRGSHPRLSRHTPARVRLSSCRARLGWRIADVSAGDQLEPDSRA